MVRSMCIVLVLIYATSLFADVVEESGVQGGVVVCIGVENGKDLAGLRVNARYLIQGLEKDATKVAQARKWLREQGLYGNITVSALEGDRLPYVDGLVNLVVVDTADTPVTRAEMERVLAPGGVCMTRQSPAANGWTKFTRPIPTDIDEWTHYLHGADNNAVAQDTVISAPKSIQWVAYPKWGRSHEQMASMSASVSANGRVFFIVDEAPLVSIRYIADWKLVARDAFNGTLLWRTDIPLWSDHLRHFRAGPVHLPRRLVALGERVYVTLGLAAPVSVLDAATGKVLSVLKGTEYTEEITVEGGTAYLAVGTSELYRQGAPGGFYERSEPRPSGERCIKAVDVTSGRELWKRAFAGEDFLLPMSMTVRNGSVFYQDLNGVGRLDAATGQQIWETKRPTVARRMSFSAPTVVATDTILLVADRIAKANPATNRVEWGVGGWSVAGFDRTPPCALTAYSVTDGSELWSRPCAEGYNASVDVFVVGETVYVGSNWRGYDLTTGAAQDPIETAGRKVGMAHHRCYRDKATVNYLLTGRSGIEMVDLKKGWQINNSWIRGTCQYGIMPANGLLYAPPDACACFNKVKVQGFFAAAGKRKQREFAGDRLLKGPAYGTAITAHTRAPADWPTYRANGQRGGAVATAIRTELKRTWTARLNGRLTQAAAVGDTVYVAETDAHTVHALSAADGKPRWSFTAGGRIDSTPTVYRGMLLFGSADGHVYCLRAEDGALRWRFMAAPEDRFIASYDQLESAWPVHGAVLLQDGALYTSAGRNSYLDDGIYLYKLDPATGDVLAKNVLHNFDPETGAQLGAEGGFDMDGVNTDILSGDGMNVFMKQERLDASLQKGENNVPHLFGIHGFLGEEWFVRSYWLLGTNVRAGWGGWASGNTTTFGRILAFDDEYACGYGRVRIASAKTGHEADDYHLFLVKKVMKVTPQPGMSRPRRRGQTPANPPNAAAVPAPIPKPDPIWSDTASLIVRAMVLTDDKLVVAGPPDFRKKTPGLLAYDNEKEALASFVGKKGVLLRVIDTVDGKTLSERALDALPVFDGLSAAQGRLLIALRNGELQCWE